MNIFKRLGLALFAVNIACNANVATIPPSPLPTVSAAEIERIEKAKACESQKVELGHYQWNWSRYHDNCFFVPVVSVECPTCTPQENEIYTKLFTDAYKEVVEAFGMEPYVNYRFRGMTIKIHHETKGRYGIWNGPDEYPFDYGKLTIDQQRGIVHEMTHVFDFHILGKHGQMWFGEGLASYIPDKELLYKKNKATLEKAKQDKDFFKNNPDWYNAHNVGYLFFSELVERGLTPEKNRAALKHLIERRGYVNRPNSWASPRIITASYEDALGLERDSLQYLLDVLRPGIQFNNYGHP